MSSPQTLNVLDPHSLPSWFGTIARCASAADVPPTGAGDVVEDGDTGLSSRGDQ